MKMRAKKIQVVLVLVPTFCLVLSEALRAEVTIAVDSTAFVRLQHGWQYCLGDVPANEAGEPILSFAETDCAWKETEAADPMFKDRGNFLWLRIRLPHRIWRDPAVIIHNVQMVAEVYFDGQLIYRSGEFDPAHRYKFSIYRWHLIPINSDYAGKFLYFRIYSNNPEFLGLQHVYFGSQSGYIEHVFIAGDMSQLILGFVFASMGLISLIIFLVRRKTTQRHAATFSFGLLTISAGLLLINGTQTKQLFFDVPVFWWYLNLFAILLFPVGVFAFAEQIFGRGPKSIIRRMWQIHLIYAVVAVLLDLINVSYFYVDTAPFGILFITNIAISMIYTTKRAIKGNLEARIFSAGFIIFGLCGLHDLLAVLDVFSTPTLLFQWGLLIFVIGLVYILERRFAKTHEQLQDYSKALEAKSHELETSNLKLEEYSLTLEQKVAARTEDLSRKNSELQDAIEKMQAMQQQLILSEKMASLGNLVAGVAHEVNNPVAAVNSAANVMELGLNKISAILQDVGLVDEVNGNEQLKKTFRLLEQNNRVIVNGSQRVAQIVKSLRNFARLDEAELQKADLHQGIESTLALLHHQLKNKVEVIRDFGEIPEIDCYPNELNQVFMNLFVNASQAIKEKGSITIKTSAQDDDVFVQVSDTGSGIPPEKINKIFDPGFTTKGVGVGTGLGLSISYNIIKKHQGEIRVESELGEGTTFTLRLPVHQTDPKSAARPRRNT